MSDESIPEPLDVAKLSRLSPRCVGGCLLVTLVVGVGVVVGGVRRGSAALDARVLALRAWIEVEQEVAAAPRPPLLASEPEAGNAADDYLLVCWILGQGQKGSEVPPLTPEAEAIRSFAFPPGWTESQEMLGQRLRDELGAVVQDGTAPSAELEAVLAGVGGATAWVRAGVRKGHCDWSYRFAHGSGAPLPDVSALRAAALLLAWEAEQADDPAEAAERGLELVAFGADVANHPVGVFGYVAGIGIMHTGYGSLERTLRRDGLDAATCRRIVGRLGALRLPGIAQALERDRNGMSILSLATSGRLVDSGDPAPAPGTGQQAWTINLWWGNGLLTANDCYARYLAAAEGPAAGRREALEAIEEQVSSPWTLQAAMALPGMAFFVDNAWTEVASRRALRVLAAAQLHRLEHGALPTEIEALQPILGELPQDPHDPAAGLLRLVQVSGELRCYSLGSDQTDDGGALPPWRGLARDAWGDKPGLDVGGATAGPP